MKVLNDDRILIFLDELSLDEWKVLFVVHYNNMIIYAFFLCGCFIQLCQSVIDCKDFWLLDRALAM